MLQQTCYLALPAHLRVGGWRFRWPGARGGRLVSMQCRQLLWSEQEQELVVNGGPEGPRTLTWEFEKLPKKKKIKKEKLPRSVELPLLSP